MGAIGRGHRVHWLLSGRPTGTAHGALQFAGHLVRGSETAGGAERRHQASAARPGPRRRHRSSTYSVHVRARSIHSLSVSLPFFPSSPPPPPLNPPPSLSQHGAAKTERGGRRGGWGGGEKSVVAMATTGREEVGLCAGRGWRWWRKGGCSVSAWKRSFAAAAAPASRQEVKTVHHFERRGDKKNKQMVSNEVGSLQWENPRRGYF